MNKILSLSLVILLSQISPAAAQGEQVVQQELVSGKLKLRPGLEIYIPYVQLMETQITGGIYLDASYSLGKVADVDAGLHLGSFKGLRIGGTLHTKDKMVIRNTKFRIGSSRRGNIETTSFYRQPSRYRVVSGPTANLRVGAFGNSGFYMRIEAGLDHQVYSRAYYRGFASNKNGFTSIKLLATVAKFQQAEMNESSKEEYKGRVGVGGLISLFHERKPWKRVSYHIGLDMGYMHVLGARDVKTTYVTFDVNKANYILELKGGFSVRL